MPMYIAAQVVKNPPNDDNSCDTLRAKTGVWKRALSSKSEFVGIVELFAGMGLISTPNNLLQADADPIKPISIRNAVTRIAKSVGVHPTDALKEMRWREGAVLAARE